MPEHDKQHHPKATFKIQIDRSHYTVTAETLTGAQLRALSTPPIPDTRDLYEVKPGHEDELVTDDTVVHIRPGLRFFTAPGRINPGSGRPC